MHGAGAALREPAAEVRIVQVKFAAQCIEQRHLGLRFDGNTLAVDGETDHSHALLLRKSAARSYPCRAPLRRPRRPAAPRPARISASPAPEACRAPPSQRFFPAAAGSPGSAAFPRGRRALTHAAAAGAPKARPARPRELAPRAARAAARR